MCDTCGCGHEAEGPDSGTRISPVHGQGAEHAHGSGHSHEAGHSHAHPHEHGHAHSAGDAALAALLGARGAEAGPRSVQVHGDVMAKNDRGAERNRGWFDSRAILALNLVSSPGAGKTALLERTLRDLRGAWPWAVIEGDQQTDNDARRIAACGARVVQVNTGAMCHLDADMVAAASRRLDPPPDSVLLIENVGNLVCPALFDLGEAAKVVIASVTEGEDKPEKYPYMFRAAGLVILNKVDLLPHVTFDVGRFERLVRQVNPQAPVLAVSATRGDNLGAWYDWLRAQRPAARRPAAHAGPGASDSAAD